MMKKIIDYISEFQKKKRFKKLLKSGRIVIIPAGFRCYTRGRIFKNLGFKQPAMPFDSGFFPPDSIVSVLNDSKVDLSYPADNGNHTICRKLENYEDSELGLGIKFVRSSYDEVKQMADSKDNEDINEYLDSTFGYYTLDEKHQFVLAHYNWHEFAPEKKSGGVSDPAVNIVKINSIMNRRIERMFELCEAADYIFFIHGQKQGFNYMMIDDEAKSLIDFSSVSDALNEQFKGRCFVKDVDEIDSLDKLFQMID